MSPKLSLQILLLVAVVSVVSCLPQRTPEALADQVK